MKLTNSTDFADQFLRRMVSWCCREVGLPVRYLRRATFRKTRTSFSGLGGGRGIVVRIGTAERFPVGEYERYGVMHCGFADQIEALVGVTAHEVFHCWQSRSGTMREGRHNEPLAMNAERSAIRAFAARRDALVAEWSAVPERVAADAPPKPNLIDRRATKARGDLARWQRKLKLAQTKVRQYRKRVAYYDRRATTE